MRETRGLAAPGIDRGTSLASSEARSEPSRGAVLCQLRPRSPITIIPPSARSAGDKRCISIWRRSRRRDAYKLLVSTVVPRPIALATTVDGDGRVNAAPFSFFNAVSSVPPVVVLGISPGAASEDGYKDTERNIRDSGEFVVNLVDEALAERMNICADRFPGRDRRARTGRFDPAALGRRPPAAHRASRRSASNAAITGLSLGARSTLEVGRVIHIHIRDDLVDPEKIMSHREDASDRPHARPRLVCPDQRPVPDGSARSGNLE